MVVNQFSQKKFGTDIRLELGCNEAIKESVTGGLGLWMISRHALRGLKKEHGVSVMDVEDFLLPPAWHVVHLSSKKLSPLALAFKQHVLKEVTRRKWDLV